jgi:peptide deformylase
VAVLPIRVVPDPILRQKSKRVRIIDDSIRKLIVNMFDTMRAAPGVGLAAPQVGVSLRVIVIEVPEKEGIALINPQIVRRTGEHLVSEGCLSVPGYVGELKRAISVTVKGRAPNGQEIRIKGEDLLAQVLQHEIDHLNGLLYVDQLESRDSLRKIEPEKTSPQPMPKTPPPPPI